MSQASPQVERVILEYEARTSDALRDIGRLDDATDNLEARIERLSSESINIQADVTVDSSVLNDLEALDSATYTPEIDPTLDDTPIKAVTDLDSETVTPEVDVQETTEGKAVLDRLDEIRNLQVIDLALNIGGQGATLLQNVVGLLGESEAAAARLTAQIGADLPDAEQRINDIFAATGAARADVAGALATGVQLGIDPADLDAAVVAATNLSTIFGGDITENLRTAQQLVKTGLVPDIQEAFDLLTAGNQSGLNADGGLAGTLTEYASTIRQAGLDGSEALGLIQSGLDAGFDNADRVLDAVREFGIRANDTGDANAQAALDTLGLPTPDEVRASGGEVGAEYLAGVIEAIEAAPAADQRSLTTALFGTQAEDFGLDTLLSLDPVNEFFDTIEGRATDAGTAFQDTLGATVERFFREAQVAVEGFLNNSTFRQTLDDFKTALQDTLDALSSGESLPDAIEIGFRIPGFSDQVDRIQSAIGNFVISLLEMIANVQSFLGKDNSGTRAEIARLAGGQLAFDVQNVDPAEIGNIIKTALDRGVSEADVGGAINTAIQEQLAAGNIQAAQDLISTIGLANATLNVAGFGGAGAQAINVQQQAGETLADFEARLAAMRDEFIAQAGLGASAEFSILPTVDTTESQQAITDTITRLETELQAASDEGRLTDALGIAEQLGNPDAIGAITGQIQDAIDTAIADGDFDMAAQLAEAIGDEDLITKIDELATAAEEAATTVDTATGDMSTAFEDADESIGNSISGNSIVPDIESILDAAESTLPRAGTYALAFAGDLKQLSGVSSNVAASVIANLVSMQTAAQSLIATLSGIPSSVGGGGGGNTNININNNVTNNSAAAAAASQADTDSVFRGNPY